MLLLQYTSSSGDEETFSISNSYFTCAGCSNSSAQDKADICIDYLRWDLSYQSRNPLFLDGDPLKMNPNVTAGDQISRDYVKEKDLKAASVASAIGFSYDPDDLYFFDLRKACTVEIEKKYSSEEFWELMQQPLSRSVTKE